MDVFCLKMEETMIKQKLNGIEDRLMKSTK